MIGILFIQIVHFLGWSQLNYNVSYFLSQQNILQQIFLILQIKTMHQRKLDFLSPHKDPIRYEATTNYFLSPTDTSYKLPSHYPLASEREPKSNPISLILPPNADSVQLNVKIKFKQNNTPDILRSMDSPLYTSPWRNNYQYNYQLPPMSSRTHLEYMQLPVYNHTDRPNYYTHQEYSSLSYKPSINLTEQQDHPQPSSFQKQQIPAARKTGSIDEDNPLFPAGVGSGLVKTNSTTFYEVGGIPKQNLLKKKISKPLPSSNTYARPSSRNMGHSKQFQEEHSSIENYSRISPKEEKSQDNLRGEQQIYQPASHYAAQYQNTKPITEQSQIKSTVSHKYTKSEEYYPRNSDYQPGSVEYLPESSQQDIFTTQNNLYNAERGSQINKNSHNFTIREEDEEPHSTSMSKKNSNQNNSFGEGFRQTVSIVPPLDQRENNRPNSNIRSSSSNKPSSIVDRPSSIQQSFQLREPSEFQKLTQFKRTSSIFPPSEADQFQHRKASDILSKQQARSLVQEQPNPIPTSIPIEPQNPNPTMTFGSELKYSQSNRPSSVISNFGPIMEQINPSRPLESNQFNLSQIPNTTFNPIPNSNFSRMEQDRNTVVNRRSSRSPERQIFFSKNISQVSRRSARNSLNKSDAGNNCPHSKLLKRSRGISLTGYERKTEMIGVPENIIKRWEAMG